MIALDSNIILRVITRDDPKQADAAETLMEKAGEKFFVSNLVLAETLWALRRIYGFSGDQTLEILRWLVNRSDIVFQDEQTVRAGLQAMADGGDFADALIVANARKNGCFMLASFDQDLAKRNPGFVIRPK